MKHIKKRWLGLVIAPALLALIGFASPANAADYSGTCANISQFNGTGNVTINNTGACSLPSALTATGFIHITSSGAITAQALTAGTDLDVKTTTSGAITTQSLSSAFGDLKISSKTNITVTGTIDSYGSIQANATSGKIAISSTVTSNVGGNGGNILLVATGNVLTGSISTNGGTTTGGVEIHASTNGGTTTGGVEIHANTNANGALFNIGTATTNGINGTINTSNSTAGGMIPDFVVGGIFITNGNANSTAGIKVIAAPNINVTASASRSGLIYLDARKGTLTLPTGPLSSTGPNDQPAGQIVLMAGTLKAVNNTVITASQTAAALSTNHGVIVAASSITVAGAGGLKINGDGNGLTGSLPTAYAQVIPTGGISVSSTAFDSNNVNSMLWTPSTITSTLNAPVTVSGTGAFTLTANGNNARAAVYAYPITFSNAAVTISSKGTTNHQVELVYSGAMTGGNGLTMSGTGAVTLDASGSAGNDSGGTIYVLVDQATINATVHSLTIKADGKGTGTGGNVTFQPTKVVSLAAPTVNMSANNGKSTSGAGVVNFQPNGGNGTAAITSTTFNLTANGPTAGNGDAGVVYFSTSALTQGSTTKSVFSAKGAAAGIGKGGFITVFPGAIADYKLGTNPGNVQVIADGGLTGGDAGRININPFPGSLTIDTANAVSAKALGGNAKGGFIQLVGNPNLSVNPTLTGATINVDGKGTSSGGEIHIFANGTMNLGSAAGSLLLSAQGDPAGTGDGGIIELGYVTTLNITDLSVSAGAGSGSNGKGGTINIHDGGTYTITGTVKADGTGTGDAGKITLQSPFFNQMTLDGATISASADQSAGTGKGGILDINNRGPITVNNAVFNANGGATGGDAGKIDLVVDITAVKINLSTVQINAKANTGSGLGGTVTVNRATKSTGQSEVQADLIKVDAGSTAGLGDLDGVVSLNGILCQQWKTGFSFPSSYWNCVNPTAPNPNDQIPANFAHALYGPAQNTLSGSKTSLYFMIDGNQWTQFFDYTSTVSPIGTGDTGVTDFFDSLAPFVTVFQKANLPLVGYTDLSVANLNESAGHEFGHAVDLSYPQATQSHSPQYTLGVLNDFLFLDFDVVGSTRPTSHPRPPCSANNTAPFDDVVDMFTGQMICNPTTHVVNPAFATYTNSKIAYITSGNIFLVRGNLVSGTWDEPYAHTFSFRANGTNLNSTNYLFKTADELFKNGWFACANKWAANLVGITLVANGCANPVYSWYIPEQDL